VTPSDWLAQHLHKPNNPQTVKDWQAALDCTVIKKGVFCLVFHPWGWIRNDQVVDLIDYAAAKYGKKVKFLNFREALERLNENLQNKIPIRHPSQGGFNGVSILDADNNGFMDISICNSRTALVWFWNKGRWGTESFGPLFDNLFQPDDPIDTVPRGGVFQKNGCASFLQPNTRGWHFFCYQAEANELLPALVPLGKTATTFPGLDKADSFLARDIDANGICNWLTYKTNKQIILSWSNKKKAWVELPFALPPGASLPSLNGVDAGLRLLDLDGDGKLDIIFSNEKEYGIYLFKDMTTGWSKKVMAGKRADKDALPMISRNGTNNGFWVHSGSLWWSNEDTVLLKDHVDRRSIKELLKGKKE
jgi:hypothetical protein